MTKEQSHRAFAATTAFIAAWTSHKAWCQRLKAECAGEATLPACNCGYFEATEKLDKDLSAIRKG